MTKIKKKYEAGAATNYISRTQAVKKLQLTLKDFRRLCILKGIYPHEPKHKKKVNKGSTDNKTWYYVKDIQFLAHEPIIRKFREYKVFLRKLKRARCKREDDTASRIKDSKPTYRLDHVVKERYPTLVDAVGDLDDALCLAFLFARLPHTARVKPRLTALCRRLAAELMHYLIAARALRKVFVSIKGIYYQVDILGETVRWVVPHERGNPPPADVDFAVIATFAEFYVTLLGFVNFGLYQSLGLYYPPRLHSKQSESVDDEEQTKEIIYSLAPELEKSLESLRAANPPDENIADEFPTGTDSGKSSELLEEAKRERKRVESLKSLFSDCKFFLNREVPRESLTFVIRCCGGKASWNASTAYGATYPESDETITHQIVDRPAPKQEYISRYYVQPQWLYDCVNARLRLPVEDYFPGVLLPPHLSPFITEKPGDYVPPERLRQLQLQGEDISTLLVANTSTSLDPSDLARSEKKERKTKRKDAASETARTESKEEESKKMSVAPGKIRKVHQQKLINEVGEQKKLREMMIKKKHKRVYHKIMHGKRKHAREAEGMRQKRKLIDQQKSD